MCKMLSTKTHFFVRHGLYDYSTFVTDLHCIWIMFLILVASLDIDCLILLYMMQQGAVWCWLIDVMD